MAGVFITVSVLGLIASLSPIVVATTASQLTRSFPVARALAVVIGVGVAVALLELMAFGLLAGLTALITGGNNRAVRIAFNLVIGGLLVFLVYRLWKGGRAAKEFERPQTTDQDDDSNPRPLKRLFVLGFSLMFFNPRVFLMITGAVTQIRALDTWAGAALLLVMLFVVVNFFPAAPVAAYLISPRFAAEIPLFTERAEAKSKPAVEKISAFRDWLLTDHRTTVTVLTLVAGLILTARSIPMGELVDRPGGSVTFFVAAYGVRPVAGIPVARWRHDCPGRGRGPTPSAMLRIALRRSFWGRAVACPLDEHADAARTPDGRHAFEATEQADWRLNGQ